MIVLDWPAFLARSGPDLARGTAMTIGVFDGVHRGHQDLIARIARRAPLIPTVITFRRSPKEILGKNWEGDILSLDRRLALFESLGAEMAVLIDFSGDFSILKGSEFLDLLRGPGNMRFLAVGANFRCGFKLDTGAAELAALNGAAGVPTELAEPVTGGGLTVSSSRIRSAIRRGDLDGAAALLGRRAEIDITGLPVQVQDGGRCYQARSMRRIIPPDGRYRALLYGAGVPSGAEIAVSGGGVFVPAPADPERIELLSF